VGNERSWQDLTGDEKVAAYRESIRRTEQLAASLNTELTTEERQSFEEFLDQNESGAARMVLANAIARTADRRDARLLLDLSPGDDPASKQIRLTLQRVLSQ
jgi:thioredoxin-like negative regulator of GroEL